MNPLLSEGGKLMWIQPNQVRRYYSQRTVFACGRDKNTAEYRMYIQPKLTVGIKI